MENLLPEVANILYSIHTETNNDKKMRLEVMLVKKNSCEALALDDCDKLLKIAEDTAMEIDEWLEEII